jgi:hypothetical protein
VAATEYPVVMSIVSFAVRVTDEPVILREQSHAMAVAVLNEPPEFTFTTPAAEMKSTLRVPLLFR